MKNLLLSSYLSDVIETPIKWVFIALLTALVLTVAVSLLTQKFGSKIVVKWSVICFVVIAIALGIFLLVAEIFKKYDSAYLEENWVSLKVIPLVFVPVLITLSTILIGSIILFFVSKRKPMATKKAVWIFVAIIGIMLVATLILMAIYHQKYIVGDGYYTDEEYGKLNSVLLYVCSALLVIITISVALIVGRKDKKPFDTHSIALAGICASLSFALSYVKLWDMPAGGSVTLVSLLPVMLFSFIYGTKKGLLVGFLYGVLQAVQDPWLIHPAQFLLDYPIAFSMVCFAGLLTDFKVMNKLPQLKFALSAVIAGSLRFLCHLLSGVFAFGAYAMDAGVTNFWLYSLAYNTYVFIDVALVVVAGVFLLSSKAFRRELIKLNDSLCQENFV